MWRCKKEAVDCLWRPKKERLLTACGGLRKRGHLLPWRPKKEGPLTAFRGLRKRAIDCLWRPERQQWLPSEAFKREIDDYPWRPKLSQCVWRTKRSQ